MPPPVRRTLDGQLAEILTRLSILETARQAARTPAYATADRPAAASVPVGTPIFDTTLGRPLWSNGTAWVSATGVPA